MTPGDKCPNNNYADKKVGDKWLCVVCAESPVRDQPLGDVNDLTSRLKELTELKKTLESGAITQTEYDVLKNMIMANILD